MKNLSEINTQTHEGRNLIAALVILTGSKELTIDSQTVNGEQVSPDDMLQKVVKLSDNMFENAAPIEDGIIDPPSFEQELETLINRHSMEKDSNTPDFILRGVLIECLKIFNDAINMRERWYGRNKHEVPFSDDMNVKVVERNKEIDYNENNIIPANVYEIWMEGFQATGQSSDAQMIGKGVGQTFDDAVREYARKNPDSKIEPYTRSSFSSDEHFKNRRSNWKIWGCALFDNETDARKSFG